MAGSAEPHSFPALADLGGVEGGFFVSLSAGVSVVAGGIAVSGCGGGLDGAVGIGGDVCDGRLYPATSTNLWLTLSVAGVRRSCGLRGRMLARVTLSFL